MVRLIVLSACLLCGCIKISASGFLSDTLFSQSQILFNSYLGNRFEHKSLQNTIDNSWVSAFEVAYVFSGKGGKQWQQFYGYPDYGISYKIMDLGNTKILGYSHSVIPFIAFPLVPQQKRFMAHYKVGAGLGYLTNKYNINTNTENLYVSTSINAHVDMGFTLSYLISSDFCLIGGLMLTHFSNGTVKKPNFGLNYVLYSFGLTYAYQTHFKIAENGYSDFESKNSWVLFGAGWYKEIGDYGGSKYGVASLSVEYSRPLIKLWRYGASFDFMYDTSQKISLNANSSAIYSHWDIIKLGLSVNTEFVFHRFSTLFYFGGYIYNLDQSNGLVYQRVAVRYRITESLKVHVGLKTHWNIADYLEIGLAFRLL